MVLVAITAFAFAALVPTGAALAASPAPASPGPAGSSGPVVDATVSVFPATAPVGAPVVVDLVGWPAGVVTVAICGDEARRGSSDCDQIGSHGVGIPSSGAGTTRLFVAPPVGCPCVVRVNTPSSDLVRTIPIDVPGVPMLSPAELGPELLPSAVGMLEVDAHLDEPGRGDLPLSGVLGGPVDRVLVLAVRNAGDAPLAGVTVSAAVGHDRLTGTPVVVPAIGTLAPGEERTLRVSVTMGAPAMGHYLVFGRVDSMAGAASFDAATDTMPWGAFLIVGLVFVVLVARSARRRRVGARPEVAEPAMSAEPVAMDVSN